MRNAQFLSAFLNPHTLRVLEGLRFRLTVGEVIKKIIHEHGCLSIGNLPKRAHHGPRAGRIEIVAAELVKALRAAGLSVAAAKWAVHVGVHRGFLLTERVPYRELFITSGDSNRPVTKKWVDIPQGRPTPFDSFLVVPTEQLWTHWRKDGETAEQNLTVSPDGARIDSTPSMPKPPDSLIRAAAREIPGILANISPNHVGAIELTAAGLAHRLREAGHTLAAAHWAIHDSIVNDRLRTGLIEMDLPSFGRVSSRWLWGMGAPHEPAVEWFGGERGTISIPKKGPTPFDCFKVTATESLWAWWRSLEVEESRDKDASVNDGKPSTRTFGSFSANAIAAVTGGSFKGSWGNAPAAGPLPLLSNPLAAGLSPHEPAQQSQPPAASRKVKKSTRRGEGRDKLIAALTQHHQYADGSCLNLEPIGNNELSRLAGVSESTASAFFDKAFDGLSNYRVKCQDAGSLCDALKALRGEFTPAELSRMTLDAFEAGKRLSDDE